MSMSSIFTGRDRSLNVYAGILALCFVVEAAGQDQTSTDQTVILEEVIVTANRREQSLQSVALAVSAFSGDDLEAQGINDIKGLTERTPGFSMGTFNPGQPQLYIRGIGSNEDGAGGDQSVIVFIDEVYIGRAAGMDTDLFDLERVEILRGPQGTLFGKNVVGGAVSMITRKPNEVTKVVGEVTAGNFNALNVRGLASGELADNVYGKISFSSRRRDGYFKSDLKNYQSFFPGGISAKDSLEVNSDTFRAGLRFLPSDALEINMSASYSKIDKYGAPNHILSSAIGTPSVGYRAESALIENYDDKINTGLYDDPGFFKSDSSSLTFRVDYDLSDDLMFTSLSAFRNVDAENSDVIGTRESSAGLSTGINALYASVLPVFTPLVYGSNDYTDVSDTFTQEFRFTSIGDGDLQWVAGAYFMSEKTDREEFFSLGLDLEVSDGGPGVPGLIIAAVPIGTGSDDQSNKTKSYAGFGQATYSFNDQLSLTLGTRYTYEEKRNSRVGVSDPFAVVGTFEVDTTESWNNLSSKLSLQYQANDDMFFYASYSEGFKSGGFQGTAASGLAASTPFDPETASLFEVGAKTEWMDNRLRLNAAIFTTDYKDLQILQLLVPVDAPEGLAGVLITQNASDAKIDGLELEFTALITDAFTVSGSYTYLDTAYENFRIPAGYLAPGAGAAANRDGNELRNAPDTSWNILARYDFLLASGAELAAQIDFRHKDLVWQDPDNFVQAAVPEYDVGDLRLIYTPVNGGISVTGWVKNFTDEDYYIHNYPSSNSGNATPAAPRTYGITVGWSL
ncbi:MAG: TonB-dependent receptor [SAR86 cluster bacterium]